MNPQDEALSVTEADREAAAEIGANGIAKAHWLDGAADWHPLVQAFAKHRLSHSTPGDAEVRKALEWYAEQAEGCRKLGYIGDPFRHALDADGGKRAREALATPSGRAQGEVIAWRYERNGVVALHSCRKPMYLTPGMGCWTETPLYAAPPAQDQTKGDE